MKEGGGEIPEKTHRPTASFGTIPTYQNAVTRPGIEPERREKFPVGKCLLAATSLSSRQRNLEQPMTRAIAKFYKLGKWRQAQFGTACVLCSPGTRSGGPATPSKTPLPPKTGAALFYTHTAEREQLSDSHKTPYDGVKRCRERKINIKTSERVNVDGEMRWEWSSAGIKEQRKRDTPEKTRKSVASSGTISNCENPGEAWPGGKPGSPMWEERTLHCVDGSRRCPTSLNGYTGCYSRMKHWRNARAGETGIPREDPPGTCNVLHVAHRSLMGRKPRA
ncbi:hypothetical protein PR048_031785 [Dryococelus australis]|uniref:Uncharacterized protein n=1 Tax=Dryococelus australis TaxID=614101 RepID=A0ABQ9GAA6_9NEOP|nr:hypothetical protein PR048_031785 [Dryococelus australis]